MAAEVIYEAATDDSAKMRYPAGDDAHRIIGQRDSIDADTFIAGMKQRYGL
jgi:hypothetical protein